MAQVLVPLGSLVNLAAALLEVRNGGTERFGHLLKSHSSSSSELMLGLNLGCPAPETTVPLRRRCCAIIVLQAGTQSLEDLSFLLMILI